MKKRILAMAMQEETDIILARQRSRTLAAELAFDGQDQTRIATAVSEIVRNVLEYAQGGRIEFWLDDGDVPVFEIVVSDTGPGIPHLEAVLEGRHRSTTGMGVGVIGARRLMDGFTMTSIPGKGTTVTLQKHLPSRTKALTSATLNRISDLVAQQAKADPVAEVRRQNQEMMLQLEELGRRGEELQILNQELSDTNRGVVALYAELEERADHLRRADQLKTRFLSNMSHEFRTPLNSIMSLSRLLLSRIDGPLASEQEKQVQFIRSAAENLTELVNNLLDIARVEAGKTVVTPKEFSVEELFGALRGMLRPILIGDAVDLVFDDANDVPLLFTDEGKVSQILRNFISNAIKFTERGEIRVWCEWNQDTQEVTFKVRDSGLGISPSDIAVIWEEFGQVAGAHQARVKGTGLGLPLARKLAELMGGTVSVESQPGTGSCFSVTLPRSMRAANVSPMPQWTVDPDKLPVLIVEDNAADSFTLERALVSTRYQPIAVQTLAHARAVLADLQPVAIVLDVMLQAEESWRLLIETRQNERTVGIPAIVVSTTHEERKARSFGADEYLDKPVDPRVLVAALDRLTGSRSTIRTLLIDDEEVSRYLIRQLLPRGAFDLTEAESAMTGIDMAARIQPDVILLDLNMPHMDGYAAIEALSNDMSLRDIPVIIATSMVLTDTERARLAKAAKIISKFDITTPILVNAIRDVVDRTVKAVA